MHSSPCAGRSEAACPCQQSDAPKQPVPLSRSDEVRYREGERSGVTGPKRRDLQPSTFKSPSDWSWRREVKPEPHHLPLRRSVAVPLPARSLRYEQQSILCATFPCLEAHSSKIMEHDVEKFKQMNNTTHSPPPPPPAISIRCNSELQRTGQSGQHVRVSSYRNQLQHRGNLLGAFKSTEVLHETATMTTRSLCHRGYAGGLRRLLGHLNTGSSTRPVPGRYVHHPARKRPEPSARASLVSNAHISRNGTTPDDCRPSLHTEKRFVQQALNASGGSALEAGQGAPSCVRLLYCSHLTTL